MVNRVIRKGVFETNSSSSHSITVSTVFDKDTGGGLLYDGRIRVESGEFGWEVESYNSAEIKASYALTHAQGNEHQLRMLKNVLRKGLGVSEDTPVVFDCNGYGYIDHQSYHVAEYAFANESTLYDFIFNRNITLHTDNDNH